MKIKIATKIVFFAVFVLSFTNTKAQNSGYLGQKNILEINSTLTTGLITKLVSYTDIGDYSYENITPLNDQRDIVDIGYGVSYFRVLSRKFAAGIYFGTDRFSCNVKKLTFPSNDYYYLDNELDGELELLDFKTLTVMPKIEFSKNSTILPVGFSHQVGFGFRTISLIEKEYESDLTEEGYNSITGNYEKYSLSPQSVAFFNSKLFDYSKNKFKAKTIMYALNMRTPISNRLLINYGFQYTLNLMPKNWFSSYSTYTSTGQYWISQSEIQDLIRRKKQFSCILFNIGLSFSF